MAEFLSVTDDYVQRSSAPGKKRVKFVPLLVEVHWVNIQYFIIGSVG